MARVLVCDDDPSLRQLLEVTLSFDHDVVLTENGQEALDHLRSDDTVECVLLDVMMPVKDGLATLRELRADPAISEVPVILVTAKAQDRDVERGMDAGADVYLSKPFDPLEVEEHILRLTSGR